MASLREKLTPEEQTLLILRVDRQMSWRDIATVMHDEEAGEPDEAELKRNAAALRKRFERVKNNLRELAREQGLVS